MSDFIWEHTPYKDAGVWMRPCISVEDLEARNAEHRRRNLLRTVEDFQRAVEALPAGIKRLIDALSKLPKKGVRAAMLARRCKKLRRRKMWARVALKEARRRAVK